jgi:hypothetical protein
MVRKYSKGLNMAVVLSQDLSKVYTGSYFCDFGVQFDHSEFNLDCLRCQLARDQQLSLGMEIH